MYIYMYHDAAIMFASRCVDFCLCSRARPSGTAMKLGRKGKDVDSFVDKLVQEGESMYYPLSVSPPL